MIKYGGWSVESGYNLMHELLQEKPQPAAVVCGNDYIAVGAIKAISEVGARIPEDISVVGLVDPAAKDERRLLNVELIIRESTNKNSYSAEVIKQDN